MRLGEDCSALKEDYGAHGGLQRWTLRGDQMEMVKRCLRTKTQGMWFQNWMYILNNSMFWHTCRLLRSGASCSQASHGCEAVDSSCWGKKGCKEVTKFWGFQVIFFLWKSKLEGSSWPVNWSSPNQDGCIKKGDAEIFHAKFPPNSISFEVQTTFVNPNNIAKRNQFLENVFQLLFTFQLFMLKCCPCFYILFISLSDAKRSRILKKSLKRVFRQISHWVIIAISLSGFIAIINVCCLIFACLLWPGVFNMFVC